MLVVRGLVLAVATAACTISSPETATSLAERRRQADMEAIERLHEADRLAVLSGDTAALMALWSDDIVTLAPGMPPLIGREANAAHLRSSFAAGIVSTPVDYSLDMQEVTVNGDHAFEWGEWSGRARVPGDTVERTTSGKLMRVLRRQSDGSWRVARTIYAVDP